MARSRMTPVEQQGFTREVVGLYESGDSIRVIVGRTGYSYGKVHSALQQAGVTLRSRGGANSIVGHLQQRVYRERIAAIRPTGPRQYRRAPLS